MPWLRRGSTSSTKRLDPAHGEPPSSSFTPSPAPRTPSASSSRSSKTPPPPTRSNRFHSVPHICRIWQMWVYPRTSRSPRIVLYTHTRLHLWPNVSATLIPTQSSLSSPIGRGPVVFRMSLEGRVPSIRHGRKGSLGRCQEQE